ncbi:hypothetical protein IV203_017306 [Nitzschia inconspicua]|uniref:Uncharacterized protein n=1 Tax=Nitzschia inconspicua TaxID=303405 RepID=A0A9K3KSA5_9STRA|nr:hypothetical protein IV203_017306 [Nitzschia inconspicua]
MYHTYQEQEREKGGGDNDDGVARSINTTNSNDDGKRPQGQHDIASTRGFNSHSSAFFSDKDGTSPLWLECEEKGRKAERLLDEVVAVKTQIQKARVRNAIVLNGLSTYLNGGLLEKEKDDVQGGTEED